MARIPLPAPTPTGGSDTDVYAVYGGPIAESRAALSELTRRSKALDTVTRELVRLRNAELQDCNY